VVSTSANSLRALETARQCAMLGARLRTIAYITGLTPGYITRAVYCEQYPAPIGRPQYSEEFFFKTTRRLQAEACLLATHYRRLTGEGFLPADALIAAYRHHRATQPASPLGFDQAFFLISRLDGIWAATKSVLLFVECLNCHSAYLAAHGIAKRDSCPVCRTDWSLAARPRTSTATPPGLASDPPKPIRPGDNSTWQLDLDIAQVRLLRRLQRLGAGDRVCAVLAAEPRASLFRAPRGRSTITRAYLSRPMPLAKWSAKTEVTHRVQYAVFAAHFRRLVRLELTLTEAMCAAFEEMRRACRDYPKPVAFDRCFEVAALLDGVWGVPERQFELVQCTACGSHHLVSKSESRPVGCPFCMLIRRHRVLLPALAA
jgi:hypothetical protein